MLTGRAGGGCRAGPWCCLPLQSKSLPLQFIPAQPRRLWMDAGPAACVSSAGLPTWGSARARPFSSSSSSSSGDSNASAARLVGLPAQSSSPSCLFPVSSEDHIVGSGRLRRRSGAGVAGASGVGSFSLASGSGLMAFRYSGAHK